jgi:hypothetical protein
MVACDGVMAILHDTPYGQKEWIEDNPASAAREFVENNPDFVINTPAVKSGYEYVVDGLTCWPDAWLIRVR